MNREDWNARYAAVPLLWKVDPGPFLGGEVGDRLPGRALDLGAGEGRNSIWLAQRGWHTTAVDFSDVAVERGRRMAEEVGVAASITFVEADLAGFDPAPLGPFDLVLLLFVHPPPVERRSLLGRSVAALAPGGMVLVAGYDRANAAEGNEGVRDPAILYTPEEIVADLAGLRVERAEQVRVGDAVDAIVRAVKD